MPARPILFFDIDTRQEALRDEVRPDDFVLRRRDEPVAFPHRALAYCADLQAERVLYTTHGDALPGLFDAPFLYEAQLAAARHVVSVPYERLDDAAPPMACEPPVLVFSPGRTGSTLLARLLSAAGAPCASEPDMLAQVCRFGREDRLRMGMEMEPALLRACLVSVLAGLGGTGVIKLRSHCNARPLPLLGAVPGARAIFMLRGGRAWARSRHRAFGEDPVTVAHGLRMAADALDKLAGEPGLTVLWFEALRSDPLGVLTGLLERAPDAAAVSAAMARDAQGGTALARDALPRGELSRDFDAAFRSAWLDARAGAEWSAFTESLLAQVLDS